MIVMLALLLALLGPLDLLRCRSISWKSMLTLDVFVFASIFVMSTTCSTKSDCIKINPATKTKHAVRLAKLTRYRQLYQLGSKPPAHRIGTFRAGFHLKSSSVA